MDLVLHRAGPSDAASVRTLSRSAYGKWVAVMGREPMPMTADYERAVIEHHIDLVEADGRLIALIEMTSKPDHLLIVNLAVDPKAQGKGYGRGLLDHAEAVARELGFTELRLYTNALMTSNIAFYERHGYIEYTREQRAPGWEIVHMRKRLDRRQA